MFRRKAKAEEPATEDQQAEELELSTGEIEAEKERKKLEREERKFLKEHQRKSQKMQRLVAPLLLIFTMIVSFLIWTFSK